MMTMMQNRAGQKDLTLDWDGVRVFLALSRTGSARGAADTLSVHYTSITRRIAAFENELGGRLFDKGPGGFLLTQLGRAVVRHAEAMEEAALAVAREVSGADGRVVGTLRLATTTTLAAYLLAEDLRAFRDAYPGIDLRIKTGYGFADLSRGEADVTIRASDHPGDQLIGRRVATYHQAVYATREYLVGHPPAQLDSGCLWMDWRTEEAFRKRQKRSEFPLVEHYMQVDDEILLLELVKAGMGIGTIPCFYGDAMADLVRVGDAAPDPVRGVWLLAHPDLVKNVRVRAFIDFFSTVLLKKEHLLDGSSI